MELSIFIGKLFAIVYLTVGIAALIHRAYFCSVFETMITSPAVLTVISLIALTVGASIVVSHNVWVPDWPVLITILGWFAMIKGMSFLIFPVRSTFWVESVMARVDISKISAFCSLFIGALFFYFSFA